jgi:hypothetical protein
MNTYEEKKAARIERMEARADRARQEAENRSNAAHAAVADIPFGQPVLVGHHSEKRHRAAIAKMERNMDKFCEALKKAEYWEDKARAAEANSAISSDDPDAIEKLTAKLDMLETQKARMKAINTAYVLYLKNAESLDVAELTEREKETVRNSKINPYQPYVFSNRNATIRQVKERIAKLTRQTERAAANPEQVETSIGAVRIVDNLEINRCQVFFPDKPSEAVRKVLKGRGFRWSPSEGAWQRQCSNAATYGAVEAARLHEEAANV